VASSPWPGDVGKSCDQLTQDKHHKLTGSSSGRTSDFINTLFGHQLNTEAYLKYKGIAFKIYYTKIGNIIQDNPVPFFG